MAVQSSTILPNFRHLKVNKDEGGPACNQNMDRKRLEIKTIINIGKLWILNWIIRGLAVVLKKSYLHVVF